MLYHCLEDLLKTKRSGDIASLFQKYAPKKKRSSTLSWLLEGVGLTRRSIDILFFNYYGFVIFQFYVMKAIFIYFMNSICPFFH